MATLPDHTRYLPGLLALLALAFSAGAFSQPDEAPVPVPDEQASEEPASDEQDAEEQVPEEEVSEAPGPVTIKKAMVLVVDMAPCSDRALTAAEAKVSDEFTALGFSVEPLDCALLAQVEDALDVMRALESFAWERGAVCAVKILKSSDDIGQGVDIWIADLLTKKTTCEHWAHEDEEEAETAQIVALKTVEMLEVSFLELALPAYKESQEPPPEPVAKMVETAKAELQPLPAPRPPLSAEAELEALKPRPEKKENYLGLRLAGSVFGSPSGVGALGGLQVALRWNALDFMALELEALIPPAGKETERGSISLTFFTFAVRAWLCFDLLRATWLRLGLGPGGGILISWASGYSSQFEGIHRDTAVTGYLGGTLQAAFIIISSVWIRLGFSAGTSLPRISVTYSGNELLVFGMPILEGFAGLELRFP